MHTILSMRMKQRGIVNGRSNPTAVLGSRTFRLATLFYRAFERQIAKPIQQSPATRRSSRGFGSGTPVITSDHLFNALFPPVCISAK